MIIIIMVDIKNNLMKITHTTWIVTLLILILLPQSNVLANEWHTRTTSHFTLYYHLKDRRLADYIMESAEEDYMRIVGDIGIDPGITTRVYLAPDSRTYQELIPGSRKSHEWSVGIFSPAENKIVLLSPKAQKVGHPDLQQIMAHELTHFVLHTITRKHKVKLPVWLNEGLAMYEARQWDWHYRSIMAQISLSKSFAPLASLKENFPQERRNAERAYAQSISVIAFILNKHGVNALHGIIDKLIHGKTTRGAFQTVLGISLEEFERQWHAYLRRRYTWVPIITSSFTIWFLISILVLGIYFYKRRQAKQKMILWELEDQMFDHWGL
ncbi:MAG: peptidase MA family metallohydrolase [bacterium]